MKRQLSDSEDKSSNKCLIKNRVLSSHSSDYINEYYVYWLDEFYSDPLNSYHVDQSKLRAIIDYLQIFNQFDQCARSIREYIRTKIFLIVNASSCMKLLNTFNDFEKVHSIYTYKGDETIDPSFDNQCRTFVKFQGIFDNPNEVFSELSKLIRIYSRHTISDETSNMLISISEKTERTTSLHSTIEIMHWFIYLYDLLEENPPITNGKEKFIRECRNRYKDQAGILRSIEIFNENYDPTKAIWWYTREGFVFRFLNRSLRQQNQNDLLLLHFFIYDLSRQLKIEFEQNRDAKWMDGHVYRGQLMSIDEIKFIERRKQQILYVNTFLSTSTDLEVVKAFAGVGYHDLKDSEQSVIFDITGFAANEPSEKSVADIHHLSFNNDENEILFSPKYTFVPNEIVYDENNKVWNIHLERIADVYDPNIDFDQYLIHLDLLIRLTLEQIDFTQSDQEKDLYQSFINDLSLLLNQLNDYQSVNITLNHNNEKDQIIEHIYPYELTALRTFLESSQNHQYKISPLLVTTLNDCLANIYKYSGKYNLAFQYFDKAMASTNDDENIRITYSRKINLAQTHKLAGDYAAAWSMFEQLNDDELTKSFSYERLYRDISLDLSNDDNVKLVDKFLNCFDFLEYTYTKADLDADGFSITETYTQLGHMYLYDCNNPENAILCFNRALDIQRFSYPEESLGFGPNYERLADAYAFLDIEKALENYKKAIDQYSRLGNMSNIDAALCWCKLGRLYNDYQIEPFNHALKLLLSSDDQQYLFRTEEIVSCLLCLAKSCARCETLFEMALEICQTIFRLYPYEPDSKTGINNDFTEWLELLKNLYEKKSRIDGSIVPTKEEFFQTWKNSSLMNTTDIIQMLNSIEQKLNANNISN